MILKRYNTYSKWENTAHHADTMVWWSKVKGNHSDLLLFLFNKLKNTSCFLSMRGNFTLKQLRFCSHLRYSSYKHPSSHNPFIDLLLKVICFLRQCKGIVWPMKRGINGWFPSNSIFQLFVGGVLCKNHFPSTPIKKKEMKITKWNNMDLNFSDVLRRSRARSSGRPSTPLCMEFACSSNCCVGFFTVLQFTPTDMQLGQLATFNYP